MIGTPAFAQDLRDFCADRPGLGTPACTVDPKHLQLELGLGDWTLDKQPDSRTDTLLTGELLARYGVASHTEARIGWTALGDVRVRDRLTGEVTRADRVGDLTLSLKQNLLNPAGDKLSIALIPTATLPVGCTPVGSGTWSVRLQAPVDYSLTGNVQLQLTPEVDAAANGSGEGRHLAYGSVIGMSVNVTATLNLAVEVQALRDRDPDQSTTQMLGGIAMAYKAREQLQFDMGTAIGLNHQSPDVQLYLGVAKKF